MRDLRELREPSSAEEIEAFETDVLAKFVLARASAGLVDSTIRNDIDLYRFKTNCTVSDLGFHKISYAAWWYSLIRPPSTFRR